MANPNLRFKAMRKKVPLRFTDSRRIIPSGNKVFNGKAYSPVMCGSKIQIDELASRMKELGYSIRIIKSKVGKSIYYDLYARIK